MRELEEAKSLVESIVENVPLMIFLKEAKDLRFIVFNRAGEDLLGYDRKELLGKNNLDLFPPEQAPNFMAKDREVLDGAAGMLDIPEETILTAKKGTRLLHTRKVCIKGADGVTKYPLGISDDITGRKNAENELKKAQFELIQSEKMAAIGRFSSGIAHEVKNPLAIILGCAELLEYKAPKYDLDSLETIGKIKDAALRANSVLQTLLAYARPSELKAEIIDPIEIIKGVLPIFEKRAELASITLIKELSIEALKISVDKNQIHQVLFNMVKNAIEAMPKGGVLTIKINKKMVAEFSKSEPACVIELVDTGSGISKENMVKIAEPFFSTKERGTGTGLGLFMAKSILTSHKGKLLVTSEEGKGAVFAIALPLVK